MVLLYGGATEPRWVAPYKCFWMNEWTRDKRLMCVCVWSVNSRMTASSPISDASTKTSASRCWHTRSKDTTSACSRTVRRAQARATRWWADVSRASTDLYHRSTTSHHSSRDSNNCAPRLRHDFDKLRPISKCFNHLDSVVNLHISQHFNVSVRYLVKCK